MGPFLNNLILLSQYKAVKNLSAWWIANLMFSGRLERLIHKIIHPRPAMRRDDGVSMEGDT